MTSRAVKDIKLVIILVPVLVEASVLFALHALTAVVTVTLCTQAPEEITPDGNECLKPTVMINSEPHQGLLFRNDDVDRFLIIHILFELPR